MSGVLVILEQRNGTLGRISLEALSAGQMARTAVFLGRTITVCDLLAMIVEHDRGHREEIANLVSLRAAI